MYIHMNRCIYMYIELPSKNRIGSKNAPQNNFNIMQVDVCVRVHIYALHVLMQIQTCTHAHSNCTRIGRFQVFHAFVFVLFSH